MRDVVIESLIETLMETAAIGSLVGTRVFKGHISGIPQPTYPMVTLSRPVAGAHEFNAPASAWDLYVSCYSSTSADEAWKIYDRVHALLKNTHGSKGGRSWWVRAEHDPVESVDDTERTVFINTSIYAVMQTG